MKSGSHDPEVEQELSRNSKTRKRKRRKARKDRQKNPTLHDIGESWTDYPILGIDYAIGPDRAVEATGHMEGGGFRVDSWRDLEGSNDYQD
jgi:hypothetical protein